MKTTYVRLPGWYYHTVAGVNPSINRRSMTRRLRKAWSAIARHPRAGHRLRRQLRSHRRAARSRSAGRLRTWCRGTCPAEPTGAYRPVVRRPGARRPAAAGPVATRRRPAQPHAGRYHWPLRDQPTTTGRVRDIAVDATLRAAAPHLRRRQQEEGKTPAIHYTDLRQKVRESRAGNLILFVVDASGSMGARERMVATKGLFCPCSSMPIRSGSGGPGEFSQPGGHRPAAPDWQRGTGTTAPGGLTHRRDVPRWRLDWRKPTSCSCATGNAPGRSSPCSCCSPMGGPMLRRAESDPLADAITRAAALRTAECRRWLWIPNREPYDSGWPGGWLRPWVASACAWRNWQQGHWPEP